MLDSDLFEETAERLLRSEFICEVTQPDCYRLLSDELSAERMSRLLGSLGRRLRLTEDGSAFYAPLSHLKTADRRLGVKNQFNTTINTLEPVVRWLDLLMSAMQRDSTLRAGELVRAAELQTIIESTAALSDELDRITRTGLFKTNKDSDGDRLATVLAKLVDEGYLVPSAGRSKLYVATGKWSYLYEVIDFVVEHEHIGSEEEESREEQQEWLF